MQGWVDPVTRYKARNCCAVDFILQARVQVRQWDWTFRRGSTSEALIGRSWGCRRLSESVSASSDVSPRSAKVQRKYCHCICSLFAANFSWNVCCVVPIRMTEDRDKWREYTVRASMLWPTLGSRTAKQQNCLNVLHFSAVRNSEKKMHFCK